MTLLDALRSARVYDLEQPRYAGAPVFPAHEPGVLLHLHRRHEPGLGEARTSASALLVMAEHSGTHIDALCHQAEEGRLHGGIEIDAQVQTPYGFTALGVDTIPPLVARGVLLDVAGEAPLAPGHVVSAPELEAAAREVELREGDVVLVRLGSGAWWGDRRRTRRRAASAPTRPRGWRSASRSRSARTTSRGTCPASKRPGLGTLPGHVLLLVRAGIYILESVFLEELAAEGVREFAFVCLPLKLRGGTGSPVRPIALAEVEEEPLL